MSATSPFVLLPRLLTGDSVSGDVPSPPLGGVVRLYAVRHDRDDHPTASRYVRQDLIKCDDDSVPSLKSERHSPF
jgi:hypothetical protein